MIRISGLRLPVGGGLDLLAMDAARALGVAVGDLRQVSLVRQSIDARRKAEIHYVCTLQVALDGDESAAVRRANRPEITLHTPQPYVFPPVAHRPAGTPVVVGTGPAGLFAALSLARAGIPCIVLERGRPVERRVRDVERFWQERLLDPTSNVQFGEGGAGTFSDGKLQTGIHDPRVSAVLETFVEMGAPDDILYQQKPHIGTDLLRQIVVNFRAALQRLGCEVRFEHTLTGLDIADGALRAVTVQSPDGTYDLNAGTLILAPGHSARDTFAMLAAAGVPMESKPFAVGVRIRHGQADISRAQFGGLWQKLPPADYKLACHLPNGRSAFSFCVCPGGEIIGASSEPGRLVVNGMSSRARDGQFINGGLLVGVTPADFDGGDPLGGVRFQAMWEEAAFRAGGGGFAPPETSVGQFLTGQGVLDACLPGFVTETLRGALPLLDRKLRGYADPAARLVGVETRSSSPVRLLRGADYQSPVRGLYPCGEGGGWAGGITSAAADGIRVAEAVVRGEP